MCILKSRALMQAISQQLFKTFSRGGAPPQPNNMGRLTSLLSELRGKDVHFDESLLRPGERFENGMSSDRRSQAAPVCFIRVDENPTYSMSIVVVRAGASIPLHDHAGMFGVIKVLRGKIRLRSLTVDKMVCDKTGCHLANTSDPDKHAHLISDLFVTEGCAPPVLTPTDDNLHKIWPYGGPAAFLEILAPPYAEDQLCRYYEEFFEGPQLSILKQIARPSAYWCEEAPYEGPPLEDSHNQDLKAATAAAAQ